MSHEHEGRQFTVNPVMTTALMVAVAVVGGIIVYAALQWFFGQSQAGQELMITGYASSSGGLEAGDPILPYVHNAGASQLEVAFVEVAGMVHFPDPSGGAGSFMIEGQPEVTIEVGDTQTVVVSYGGPILETGMAVTVVEAGDSAFSVSVIIGEKTT